MESQQHSGHSVSLRIVLLGPAGSGKSATANGILGKEVFPESRTTGCNAQQGEFQGQGFWVIDTPGLSESAEAKREIRKSCTLGPSAPTAFLFFVDLRKGIDGKWKQYLWMIEEIFGKDTLMHVMILFTQRETLTKAAFEKLLKSEKTQDLIEKCGGRYHAVNSKAEIERSQLVKLLKKIEGMMKMTRGQPPKMEMTDVKIVLLGKTGAGKSASGNTILGKSAFAVKLSPQSVTKTCNLQCTEISGKQITLIDARAKEAGKVLLLGAGALGAGALGAGAGVALGAGALGAGAVGAGALGAGAVGAGALGAGAGAVGAGALGAGAVGAGAVGAGALGAGALGALGAGALGVLGAVKTAGRAATALITKILR